MREFAFSFACALLVWKGPLHLPKNITFLFLKTKTRKPGPVWERVNARVM